MRPTKVILQCEAGPSGISLKSDIDKFQVSSKDKDRGKPSFVSQSSQNLSFRDQKQSGLILVLSTARVQVHDGCCCGPFTSPGATGTSAERQVVAIECLCFSLFDYIVSILCGSKAALELADDDTGYYSRLFVVQRQLGKGDQ